MRSLVSLFMPAAATLVLTGCFAERTIPFQPGELIRRTPGARHDVPPDTRRWLAETHAQLAPLLPADEPQQPLLTADLARQDDVVSYFGRTEEQLVTVLGNFYGLLHTAQAAGGGESIGAPVPPWPGFADVRIPVRQGMWLYGRLGYARDDRGRPLVTDCVVLIPGLFGDNAVARTRTLAEALVGHGVHALALEQRGAGETERQRPDLPYNFGVLEAGDLLAVSDWLMGRVEVRRTGLIGYCWGANTALTTAWEDGRPADDPDVAAALRPHLHPRCGRRHFAAGVLAFSPVIDFDETIAETREAWSFTRDPVLSTLQKEIRWRQQFKGYDAVDGGLRTLIDSEYGRSVLSYPGGVEDGLRYLRWLPDAENPDRDKLEDVRVPVLIVHGSNDPLARAQRVADVVRRTENPNVAALMLRGGGHVGFAAYARGYFFSLMLNFFDPQLGPAAAGSAAVARQ